MHSADYNAVARCLSVRLSVCLSHAGILSKWLNVLSDFVSPSGSQTILVFPYQTIAIFRRRPPYGGIECKGYENHDFRPISRFISEMMQDKSITIEMMQNKANSMIVTIEGE